jgi:predicted kinase
MPTRFSARRSRVSAFSYVIVSGPPGSGKSTLAALLADRLGLPLFAKDTIKEALMDALGAPDIEASRRLGAAAIRTLLALAHENRRGVLESNWRASVALDDLRALPGSVVEVFCDCDTDVSRARYERRGESRHPGHFDAARVDDESLWAGEASLPLDGGWHVVRVNTSAAVDMDVLLARLSSR